MKRILGVLLMSVILACSMISEPSFERDSDDYQKMVKSALVDTGNNYRLKTVIEKIKKWKKCFKSKKSKRKKENSCLKQ